MKKRRPYDKDLVYDSLEPYFESHRITTTDNELLFANGSIVFSDIIGLTTKEDYSWILLRSGYTYGFTRNSNEPIKDFIYSNRVDLMHPIKKAMYHILIWMDYYLP